MKIFLVLLAILKYAFLLVIFLLILILLLVLISMISPIRYKAIVHYKEENLFLSVNITYLSKIVGIEIKKKNEKLRIILRFFTKKINLSPDKPKKKKNSKNAKVKKKKDLEDVALEKVQKLTPTNTLEENVESEDIGIFKEEDLVHTSDEFDTKPINDDVSNLENPSLETEELEFQFNEDDDDENTDEDDIETEDTDDKSTFVKIQELINKIKFYIESYKTYPYRERLIKKTKKVFSNLFDAIIPKVIDLKGKIWVNDPAMTGQALGAIYAMYAVNSKVDICIDGDFENEKNDLTCLIAGRIIIFKLVQPVISLLWLGLKAEAKRRKITRLKLIRLLINKK